MTSRPLDGLRVVELADEQGEWAGKLLSDMGADVVKVEPPSGAATRRIGPFVKDEPDSERSLHFWHYNTGKRSVTLNLDTKQGRAIWLQLPSRADVMIETASPGTLDKVGIGHTALSTANPMLVTASITPWGQDGPYADFASGDLIQMAMGGIANSCGYDDHDIPPVRPGANHAYHIASHHAVIGILVALYARDSLGRGQHVDIAVHDCVAACTEFAATFWFYAQTFIERQTGRHAMPILTAKTQLSTRDGRWVNFTQTQSERIWHRFLRWAEDAGFGELFQGFGDTQDRLGRGSELLDAMQGIMAAMDTEDIWHTGQRLGLPWGAVRRPEEWLDDPHPADRGFFQEVRHESLPGPIRYPGPPYGFTEHPGRVERAPHIGEHNAEVYGELGYDAAELASLREEGVI